MSEAIQFHINNFKKVLQFHLSSFNRTPNRTQGSISQGGGLLQWWVFHGKYIYFSSHHQVSHRCHYQMDKIVPKLVWYAEYTRPKRPNLEMVFCEKGPEKVGRKPIWRLVWHLADVYINDLLNPSATNIHTTFVRVSQKPWPKVFHRGIPYVSDTSPLVRNSLNTWDIKHFVPWMKSDFLRCKKFNYVSDFARCKKLRTKIDFDLVIVEESKLGTKSDYNCRRKSRKKFEYK